MVTILDRLKGRLSGAFSYDVLNHNGKRKSVSHRVPMEDHWIRGIKKQRVQATSADLARNLSIAGWMVRRHLDYVASFAFYSRNARPDNNLKALDDRIQELMAEDSIPSRTDAAGKFSREKMFRLAEARRVLDGDTYLLKLANMRLQGIQADLVKNPTDMATDERWINGHRINGVGRTEVMAVWNRTGYQADRYSRNISSRNLIHYGFFERFAADQVRGVSPITSALNPLRDVYENFDFALAKAKISQLFALAFYQDGPESPLDLAGGTTQAPADDDGDHVEDTDRGFQSFVKSDLKFVDLDAHEKLEIIESKTPSAEFREFTMIVIAAGMKALDLPFTLYDESHGNFHSSRGAWIHYDRSCADKRADQIELRRRYTLWKLRGWIMDGRLELPAGMTIADLRFEWVPRGLPFWKPSEEVKGSTQAIAGGLDNPQRVCMATDTDFYDNVDKIAQAEAYAASRGVTLSWDSAPDPDPIPARIETDD